MKAHWIPALLLAACGGEDWSDPEMVAAATTEVRIIEAIVTQKAESWAQQGKSVPTSLVLSEMGGGGAIGPSSLDRAQADGYGWGRPDTWDAFFASPARSLRIPPRVEVSFHLVSDWQISLATGPGFDWYGGGAGYPGSQGYYSFDKLTLSYDGTEAIVLGAFTCGGLCGSGSIYHLVLEDGVWRIAHMELLWIS